MSNNNNSTEESVKDIKTESLICSSNIFASKDYSVKSGFTYGRKCEERHIQDLSREDFKTCDNRVNICNDNFKHFISLNDVQEVTSASGRSAKAFGHSQDKRFVCPFCGKGFRQKYSFEVHYRNSIGEKPYICDICGKGFVAKNLLTKHLVHHSEEKPFACDSCEKRYNKKGNLTRHLRSHTGEKPYKCFLCAKAFIYCGDRKRHCKNIHGIKLARNICRGNLEL
ncbi:unnamed protein product [Larinioides sclopetarius]|uniref:C2H2-type domain-containing protein n=1 Tax=Larinioides sclopetarius TaxID=280406 RepID=A0AAV2B9F2_9ARAC